MKKQRVINLTLAVLASGVSLLLSWPYWRDYEYWAESEAMWIVYFVVGFILAVYVFYVFLGNVRTLFEHDAIEREAMEREARGDASTDTVTPGKEGRS